MTSDRKLLRDNFMHLTNYALNKDSSEFRQAASINDETGHKRTITSLFKQLAGMGHNIEKLKSRIHDLVLKTIISI